LSPPTLPSPSFFFLLLPPPPLSTLFPYTTLFRSRIRFKFPGRLSSSPAAASPSSSPAGSRPASSSSCPCPRSAPYARGRRRPERSEEHTSELQSLTNLVCRLLLEKKKHTQRCFLH